MKTRMFVGLLLVGLTLTAQAKKPWEEYGERIKSQESIGILGEDLFGDTVNYQDGALSFSATDISLPGNSSLPVALKRTFSASGRTNATAYDEAFGDWELDLPRLSGVFAPTWQNQRCSSTAPPPAIGFGVRGTYVSADYWNGNSASMPYGGEMLAAKSGVPVPATGGPYIWMTPQFTYFSCLTTIKNGPGEGFLAITPDGTKYWFDWMAQYQESQLSSPTLWASDPLPLGRMRNVLYASRVEDRFGNWVTYTYTNAAGAPAKLTTIAANDGRNISLTYNAKGQIATASNGSQTWTYQYSYPNNYTNTLSAVTLPDTRSWQINFLPFSTAAFEYDVDSARDCSMTSRIISSDPIAGTITHPSGAIGQFEVKATKHGRSNVPMACINWLPSTDPKKNPALEIAWWPRSYDLMSLSKKTISGPGIITAQWDFATGSLGTWAPGTGPTCASAACAEPVCVSDSCAGIVNTTVTGPDGKWKRYTFGNSYRYNEGKLLKLESGTGSTAGPTAILETQNYTYELAQSGQAFAIPIGTAIGERTNWFVSASLRPEKVRTIVKEGVTYTSTVNVFDSFARSTDVTRSNSNGFSKNERMVYADNTSKWVLGHLATQTDVATNQVEQSNTYDSVNANLLSKSAFGVLQESYTYNVDGTLATVKDGKNNTYTLSSWMRGIPRTITAPDGTTQSGAVNNAGWLTSVTNQRGYVTGYTYDALGRLTGVTPPTGDTVAWAGTTLSFAPLTTATFGVPAGGWLHSISRGNYRKETYMDALYRPLVIREYDNANATGTRRFAVKAYDTSNREVFSSYPGISSGLTLGTRTTYDALDRVIENKADSELGTLTTTTQYLTGGGIKVTGPDGNITTRSFRSLDAPSYDQMISEAAPGGVTTTISRDVFGKPLTITRSGSDGLNISKQFAYDANQRLCMRTEPETGTSIIDYDAAGNVLWAANGQAVANPAVCDRAAAVAGAKINYTYDALNRVTKTDDPTPTSSDPTVTYLPDGTVNTFTNGTATWTYTYNKLGKPVTESLNLGGKISTITHAYDTLANEASLTYPNGTNIAYLPNALGQPTKAGTYATDMTYRASGFLSAMTYGNGATYSAQPNLRGLPARRLDKKGTTVITDELMAYDQDANPVCVRDSTTGNPGSRDFTYDARDRLIKASAPNQAWISSEYQYDSQDNIKMARLGTRQYNYSYNANNRLLDIGQPATAPVATNFGLLSCADYSLLTDLGSGGTAGSLTITPTTLPNGQESFDYPPQTLSATGGAAPYTFAITAGKLPLGLSLSGGVISGLPVRIEIQTFTITATDSYGSTGSRSYTISISGGQGGGGGGVPLSITPMLLAGDTLKYNFIHDVEGRMTQKGTQVYVFDALNRMTKVTGKESYLYDGHGRRVQVTKTSDGKINYPIYGLDGKLLLEDNRQTLTRTEYIYANDRLIAKRIQPITSAGANNGAATVTTIHTDFLGSPVAETNSTGTVSRVERYTPYGEPSDMALDAGPGFTGHATDVLTGLTYMQQRYYDAEIGRFISPDPVGPEEDFINHFNRYNYAQNNPIRNVDPDGRSCTGSRILNANGACASTGGNTTSSAVFSKEPDSSSNDSGKSGSSFKNTPEQLRLLESGKIKEYYSSRSKMGDTYASLALDVVNNEGALGLAANVWLFRNVALQPDAAKTRLLGGGTYIDFVIKVNIGIANAHARAVDADFIGVPGKLSANQISQYHEEYFQSLGLPSYTFGGSAFYGYRTTYWCDRCDENP